MKSVITRLFDTYDTGVQAVRELESNGVPHDDISLVANNSDGRYSTAADTARPTPAGTTMDDSTRLASDPMTTGDTDAPSTGAGTGASIGTILGGGAGLLAGLGMLAIPGVGPVVAAGWLVATAVGAGIGAAGGGILGSLVGAGVSEEHANVYAEGVRRGGTLVTVRADEAMRPQIEQVLNKYSPVDADARGAEYRADGWTRFDENAPSYTPKTTGTVGSDTVPTSTTRL